MRIVFKHHPTTDKRAFAEILERCQFTNFEISDEHYGVLIAKCDAVFSTIGTSIFMDAPIFDKPNILFISNKLTNGKSNGHFSDEIYKKAAHYIIRDDLNELATILVNKDLQKPTKSHAKTDLSKLVELV